MPKRHVAPELYLNRELGQLAFNRRVLALAEDRNAPLLERLRFLCIVDSNLDEFFEIRVAGLKEEIAAEAPAGPDGVPLSEVFRQVTAKVQELVARQYQVLNDEVFPQLAAEGIRFLRRSNWNAAQKEWVKDYFFRELMPVLTPLGLDPVHPFPKLLNKSLNFVVELEGKDAFGRKSSMAIVQAPRVLPRVITVPRRIAGCPHGFVFLSSILHAHVAELFPGMTVLGCYQFQLTRNSDLYIDEEELRELKSLRQALQGELTQRQYGDSVRLEVADLCSPRMTDALLQQFGLTRDDLYQVNGPVNLMRLLQVYEKVDRPDLKFPLLEPALPKELSKQLNIFDAIRKSDILLHQPYESFAPVVNFLKEAANDPHVVAIKQTVYRTGAQSEMMDLLIHAARNGKAVTVVVELMARFDEEANINWAQRLEEVGAHVVYGVVGHKTHAKMALVVRREGNRLARYVHLATGNYHSSTARFYTDFGLFTCNDEVGSDVSEVFMQLTGLGKALKLKHLLQSPFTLHQRTIKAIQNEARNARDGKKARIIAKMNALLEPEIIAALYDASQAGVKIDLVVRGVCALRPRVAGVSENIRVRSVLGRFLEHSRVFYFHNGGAEDVYLSSADWMDRNFFRRIEVCFPVLNKKLKKRVIREGLMPFLERNIDAWEMSADGQYRHLKTARRRPPHPQTELLKALAVKPPANLR
ncbi:MAG: ppk1 [Betaproteobacteria bacterium]|nr:ppk1 [Betaproteobacteria bacterium]